MKVKRTLVIAALLPCYRCGVGKCRLAAPSAARKGVERRPGGMAFGHSKAPAQLRAEACLMR